MEILLLLAVCIGFWIWIFYRLSLGKRMKEERNAIIDAARKKDPSDLTEDERKLLLEELEKYGSQLTPTQYDVLKAKYTGTTSATEMAIKLGLSPTQMNGTTSTIKTQSQNDGTKTIIKDAVVGGVIAGPAGAVVGAIVGKNNADNNSQSNNK